MCGPLCFLRSWLCAESNILKPNSKEGSEIKGHITNYLKLVGENTPIQSSTEGFEEPNSNVTHSMVSPYKTVH